ncbi:MAG: low molecular weight phosphotyrosine protein phosphatase [Pseudomonadales bacterium]|jgi:protein-tyrosine phosphatase|nr:low molecular weight phosphotyrosine protein phosphatase [Pseudomonadales bacterium]MCP5320714.1 low molecular weight phosphotyrosine protein phosphatase [Pseudomonadales bacterium]MCP5338167.1 low molecular weight phosphotyrosine protein phosphatase [Pseudomonadales bacterium]
MTVGVLFVCLGNICRSPTADAVFTHKARALGLDSRLHIDSAGTGDWHLGEPPDRRSQRHAAQRGYDLSMLRARQVLPGDFRRFDFVLAMDRSNLADLERLRPGTGVTRPQLLLPFGSSGLLDVPDPYHGDEREFEAVLDLIEEATDALLAHIRTTRL